MKPALARRSEAAIARTTSADATGRPLPPAHIEAILAAYDWGRFRTIVDVAGADGTLLCAILAAAPKLRGIIFDQCRMQGAATRRMAEGGLQRRCLFVGGDVFEAVPAGWDAYLLNLGIRDWDDGQVAAILRSIRKAAPGEARLIAFEALVSDGEASALGAVIRSRGGGRKREAAALASLFAGAGFRPTSAVTTASPVTLIEAVPA